MIFTEYRQNKLSQWLKRRMETRCYVAIAAKIPAKLIVFSLHRHVITDAMD